MKKILILAMTIMVSLATSCTKDLENPEAPAPTTNNDPYVIISLQDSEMETRTFFDNNLAGESWERALNNVVIFIAWEDENGDEQLSRTKLSSDEIANMRSSKITLDGAQEGDLAVIMVAANMDIPEDIEYGEIYNRFIASCDIEDYNGTFEQISIGSKRDDGFEMKYMTFHELEDDTNILSVTLERQVAKVAIQTSISDNFQNPYYYPGSLRIDSIDISSYENTSVSTLYYTGSQDSYHTNGVYNNLFYLYHSYMNSLTINATYDIDGDFSTTEDQSVIKYPFKLLGSYGEEVEVLPNHYYRASITINGLNRQEIELTLSVADWEDTEDQNVDIG